ICTNGADDCQKYERGDRRVIPVANDHSRRRQQVIQAWRIKTESGVAISPVRISQPAGLPISCAELIVKGQREVEMIRQVAALWYAVQHNRHREHNSGGYDYECGAKLP